jgi:putative hydrolase of the HAD superfamily
LPVWIFDLDNTLHNASRHAFPVINRAMNTYLAARMGLSETEAGRLRTGYWHRYGATLTGLMRHHPDIDPLEFIIASHPLDELLSEVHPMPGLKRTLARLPGRKILFTNGARGYAERLLSALGIAREFDGIFSVEDTGLRPKPQMRGYMRLLKRFRLDPYRCVMVEDSRTNLLPAKRLGMKTIWLRAGHRAAMEADVSISQLAHLARIRLPKRPSPQTISSIPKS